MALSAKMRRFRFGEGRGLEDRCRDGACLTRVGFVRFYEDGMLEGLKSLVQSVKKEIQVYQLVRKDPRTPKLAKWLLGIAIGYFLTPFDIIPDFIPVLGHLDDVVIIPTLVILALKMIPKEVIEECRQKVVSEQG